MLATNSLVKVKVLACAQLLSHVQLFMTPWTVAHQAPLSMRFSRQEHWSGEPWPPPGDLPDPGIELASPALAGWFFTINTTWEAQLKTSAFWKCIRMEGGASRCPQLFGFFNSKWIFGKSQMGFGCSEVSQTNAKLAGWRKVLWVRPCILQTVDRSSSYCSITWDHT